MKSSKLAIFTVFYLVALITPAVLYVLLYFISTIEEFMYLDELADELIDHLPYLAGIFIFFASFKSLGCIALRNWIAKRNVIHPERLWIKYTVNLGILISFVAIVLFHFIISMIFGESIMVFISWVMLILPINLALTFSSCIFLVRRDRKRNRLQNAI